MDNGKGSDFRVDNNDMKKIYDFRKAKRKRNVTKTFKRLGFLLIVCTLIAVGVNIYNGLDKNMKLSDLVPAFIVNMGKTGEFPVDLGIDLGRTIVPVSSGMAVVCERTIRIIDTSGVVMYEFSHGYKEPRIVSSENAIATYSKDGTAIKVSNERRELYTHTTEGQIVTAAISTYGKLLVASRADNFASQVEVFDSGGDIIFKWQLAQNKVIGVSFYNEEHILVTSVNVKDGDIVSVVTMYSIFSGEEIFEIVLPGTLAYSAENKDKNNVIIIGNNRTLLLDESGKILDTYEYSSGEVVFFQSGRGKRTVIGFKDYSSRKSTNIVSVITENNRITTENYTVYDNIRAISAVGNQELLMSDNALYLRNGNSGNNDDNGNVVKLESGYGMVDIEVIGGMGYVLFSDSLRKFNI